MITDRQKTQPPGEDAFKHDGPGQPGFLNWINFLDSYGYASKEVLAWLAEVGPYRLRKRQHAPLVWERDS